MRIEPAGLSDVGKKREINEDAFLIDEENRLFVLADGMGGHLAGEVASSIVVETVQSSVADYFQSQLELNSDDESLSDEANALRTSIKLANNSVYTKSRENSDQRGMGSTVAGVLCTDFTIVAANVGDSPIFLIRNGKIEPLSMTHTVEAEIAALADEGDTTLPLASRYHHMLTRAVGTEESVSPYVCEVQYFDGDTLVICSDGLTNKVTPDEIFDIAMKHPPQEACEVMVGLANGRGGEDNITVIVVKFGSERNLLGNIMKTFSRLLGR